MRVLITGSNGFIGKNLKLYLSERKDIEVICFTRQDDLNALPLLLMGVDFVFHFAGINRTDDPTEFFSGNLNLTHALCDAIEANVDSTGEKPSVIYASSIHADGDTPYAVSKRGAEQALFTLAQKHQLLVYVFRLPNVFGKWSKPNYNSVVATFCHNIARGIPTQVNDKAASITLVYVDDLIVRFSQLIDRTDLTFGSDGFAKVNPQYTISVGELANQIQIFKDSRSTLMTERVGTGLLRALFATYVSFLPVESFSYKVPQYIDPRGHFVEMLKTLDSGQFSYFTAHPGTSRGGHYHHSKTEKFMVIQGFARFRFRHMQTGQVHEILATGEKPEIVETIPGWTHDITNMGTIELIVLLWANEVFDRARPDTFACPVQTPNSLPGTTA